MFIFRKDRHNLSELSRVFIGTCWINTEEEFGSIGVSLLHQELLASDVGRVSIDFTRGVIRAIWIRSQGFIEMEN